MAESIQLPIGLSGFITKIEGMSYCMDGATHLIHTATDVNRLKGANEAVNNALDAVADGKTQIMILGYPTWGPECRHILVHHVAYASDVNNALIQIKDWRPWPWKVLSI